MNLQRELKNIALLNATKSYNFRQVLFEDFKSIGHELPIKGGWGYTDEDAIIIDKNDPTVEEGIPFDGVALEYFIVLKRIYEELIIFRNEGEKYSGIEWNLQEQQTYNKGGKTYDKLTINVTAFRDSDWETLSAEYEDGIGQASFNKQAHEQKREELKYYYQSEYFFEITSFA